MSGFLDSTYGVADARRERRIKLIVVWSVSVLIVASVLYFTFRNWRQEQVVKQFITLIKQQQYQEAYKLWGCTQETPCKYYPPEKFNEDWGPAGEFKDIVSAKIQYEDVCGSGVIFTIAIPKKEPFGLEVQTSNNVLGFALSPRCSGKHIQLWEFLKSKFS
jgi:hypothetical protein